MVRRIAPCLGFSLRYRIDDGGEFEARVAGHGDDRSVVGIEYHHRARRSLIGLRAVVAVGSGTCAVDPLAQRAFGSELYIEVQGRDDVVTWDGSDGVDRPNGTVLAVDLDHFDPGCAVEGGVVCRFHSRLPDAFIRQVPLSGELIEFILFDAAERADDMGSRISPWIGAYDALMRLDVCELIAPFGDIEHRFVRYVTSDNDRGVRNLTLQPISLDDVVRRLAKDRRQGSRCGLKFVVVDIS